MEITVDLLREMFRYEPETGLLYLRKSDKKGHDISKPVGWSNRGYLRVRIGKTQTGAHRIAWALHYGEFPGGHLDHIDRNPGNNRISNLRIATVTENARNVGVQGRIMAKGVSWHKEDKRYYARIRVNGKRISLGRFDTVDEAAHAYNKAAIQYHGEFALLNPIGEDKHV